MSWCLSNDRHWASTKNSTEISNIDAQTYQQLRSRHRNQEIQIKVEAKKTLVDTMRRKLEAKKAEVTADFLGGLETTKRKLEPPK
jgi:hypothetical protein